ncbi:uncharacterized protein LOC112126419 [Cimex lectularius]|uniref:Chitin-binding type-2 domain-containing protein n=1 Tax=Cimex lectularius TaxID=79782 RepID=A0A8I6SS97_CIMLE|nr:uncharacterized protein LOC112126419 [Cimex lectularius]
MGLQIVSILALSACVGIVLAKTTRVLASPDIPQTSFSCTGRPIGYYADVETDCQVYHMCGEGGRQYSYACPNTTLFHQRMLICAHWYQVNCTRSPEDYHANLLIGQRDKLFVEDISASEFNSLPSGEDLQRLNNYYPREKASKSLGFNELNLSPTQLPQTSSLDRSDLQHSPSASLASQNFRSITSNIPFEVGVPSPRSTPATEATRVAFRPTNVSFRSTIETPNSEAVLARTAPMTSSQPASRTEPADFNNGVTPSTPEQPSLDLLPPFDASQEESNTIELHLHDPRREFYIPPAETQIPRDEPIVVSINVHGKSRFKPTNFVKRRNSECSRCHPMFVIDKQNCSPCLLVR